MADLNVKHLKMQVLAEIELPGDGEGDCISYLTV